MHLDVELTLGWNLIETTTAGITLHINNTQTVAGIFTDALERSEQTGLNLNLQLLDLLLQFLLFGTGFFHDLVELSLLHIEGLTTVINDCLILLQLSLLLFNLEGGLLDFLVAELDFQRLELDFLRQCVVLTVVLHVVQLRLVALYASLGGLNLALLLGYGTLILVDVVLDLLDAGGETCNLIFQVFYFQRQLTSEGTLLVNLRERGLQLIEGLQTLFY